MRAVIDRTNRRRTALAVLASLTVLAACAGENIFAIAAGAGGVQPAVNITAPAANLAIALGDSVFVKAEVSAPAGATSVLITSRYATTGTAAFTTYSNTALSSATTVSLSQWLQAITGQVTGTAYVVVQVTDLSGAIAVDSVKVSLN